MRRDENSYDHTVWLRSKRIFHSDDGWYVDTRDRKLGPFPFRRTAVIELRRYLVYCLQNGFAFPDLS